MATTLIPKIIFLKQTVSARESFWELGIDSADRIGPAIMYSDISPTETRANLKAIKGPSYQRKTIAHRLWSWLKYFSGAVKVVWSAPPTALLFIVAQPPYLPVLGYIRNRWLGQKYVVWVDDIYPDVLVRYGLLSARNPVVRIWQKLNILMLSRAERVFTLGPFMARILSNYLPGRKSKTTLEVVPTWVDPELTKPIPKEKNPFAQQYGQIGKLTVLYSGNMGLTHDIGTMVQAARLLVDYPDIHFIIIGSGPGKQKILDVTCGLKNLTLLPLQPDDVVPFSLATANIAVITQRKGIEGISMPSKTYHFMATGAALIGISHAPSDLQWVIDHYHCGVNIEPGDAERFVQAVLRFRAEPKYLHLCRENSRKAAETDFSRKVNVQRVLDSIEPFLYQT